MKSISKIAVGLSLLLLFTKGNAQELIHTFSEPFNMAYSDPFGQFYLVQEDQIVKTDSLGQILYTFSDPGMGNVSWIDASDPFRVLVYYRSFNQIIFLDRTLSTLGDPVNLDDLEIFVPAGICRSSLGGFWIIDKTNSSLIHLDNELNPQVNIILSGLDMDQDESWFPMLEWKERLYLCKPQENILLFDLYGTHLKNIPVKVNEISYLENTLLFIGTQLFYQYQDYPGILSEPKNMNLPEWEKLVISKNHALIYKQLGWYLFHLKKTP